MCRSSRAIIFRFNSKTHWQMFLLLYVRHVCVPRKDTNVESQSSINLGDTLLQITRKRKTVESWLWARLFICPSSIVSQFFDFIHWMVTILVLITWLVKTENFVSQVTSRKIKLVKSVTGYRTDFFEVHFCGFLLVTWVSHDFASRRRACLLLFNTTSWLFSWKSTCGKASCRKAVKS